MRKGYKMHAQNHFFLLKGFQHAQNHFSLEVIIHMNKNINVIFSNGARAL